MHDRTSEESPASLPWKKILRRLLTTLLAAFIIGWLVHQLAQRLDRSSDPAGFGRGVVQGALMPVALPNLLVGKDVVIYAQHNTGVSYKLGYTVGVNACGAIFFGFFFWRLNRLRKNFGNGRRDGQ